MNLGAEPKKLVGLGLLVVVGGYLFYTNVLTDPNDDRSRQPGGVPQKNQAVNGALDTASAVRGPVARSAARSKSSEEFRPSMKRKPEEAIDPMAIDPTLRLDLLARAQNQQLETLGRNPFQFGQPPPPPVPPAPKVIPKTPAQIAAEQAKKVEAAKSTGPPKPPPLNLSWKYYGYTSPRGSSQKRAFFLDGEEIMTANEGEVLKRKYRVVRIGVNSVVVEDTDTKSQQTFPLQEEAVG
jgi:hypothetical protein